MQIKSVSRYNGKESRDELSTHITQRLEESIYDGGELETLGNNIDNINTFLGELSNLLVEKEILSLEELEEILPYSLYREIVL